jgi:ABC-type cobalamin/Fe3+-siderophores transport system ATPase subunit
MSGDTKAGMRTVTLPSFTDPVNLEVGAEKVTLILGANGTGKSALVHHIVKQLSPDCVYLPGSRPSYFDNDSLSITPQVRLQLNDNIRNWDQNAVMRHRPSGGTQRNEKAVYDLQSAEVQFKLDAADRIEKEGSTSDAIALLQSHNSPLDRANHILRLSNLPIQLIVDNAQIVASRSGEKFSLARMSDGERAALILLSEVKSAKAGRTFMIDEPELHLHRSIVVPLIKSLVIERPDCSFVISTHELALADEIAECQVLLVRGCRWSGGSPSAWDLDLLPDAASLPDDLRVDILGSRRVIVFVEGKSASLDRPLYALLFPHVSVRPKETCLDVRRAVDGLNSVSELHGVRALGIVDNDGMSTEFVAKLEANGIFALPFYSVESLYYMREVRNAVAMQQALTLKADAETLMKDADVAAIRAIDEGRVDAFAGRVVERRLRDALLSALPDLKTIMSDPTIKVELPSLFSDERKRLQDFVAGGDIDAIIERYPVRDSSVPDAIAKALRLLGRGDYQSAALARIEAEPALAAIVRAKLGNLTGAVS